MLWIYLLIASVTGGAIHSYAVRRSRRGRTVELFLVYLLVGYYGLAMILSGAVHLLNPRGLAALKGWPVSEPMHSLYAFALFGLAGSALLAAWFRGTYLLAPAISGSMLAFGGAYVHGAEILDRGSFILAKDATELLFDVVVPSTILALAAAYAHQRRGGDGLNAADP
jgi:hypothetical protein